MVCIIGFTYLVDCLVVCLVRLQPGPLELGAEQLHLRLTQVLSFSL